MPVKHLVQWSRPEPILIGKNKIDSGELLYRSKCGRFEIRRRHYASGRNGYLNTVAYIFTVVGTDRASRTCDSLADAKRYANWEIDPNWEG